MINDPKFFNGNVCHFIYVTACAKKIFYNNHNKFKNGNKSMKKINTPCKYY